jgi:beta-carotene 3-hydroxylase
MDWLTVTLNIFLVVGTFFFMEGVAWFTHKYIMHGFLWTWHKSHHELRKGYFERNDLFAVVFSVPAVALIVVGTQVPSLRFLLYIGVGVTAYGIFYVLFHDILVHRRVKINFKPTNRYLQRMIRAHYIHHAKHTKENCEAFGFLYAPPKYEKTTSKKA